MFYRFGLSARGVGDTFAFIELWNWTPWNARINGIAVAFKQFHQFRQPILTVPTEQHASQPRLTRDADPGRRADERDADPPSDQRFTGTV